MPCTHVSLPGGGHAIVCGPKPRFKPCRCGNKPTVLCDWKVPERPTRTCDAPLCPTCTYVPAPDKDLCPTHAAEWKARLDAQAQAVRSE